MLKTYFQSFFAGFISTLIFHQGGLFIFWLMGLVPLFPWDMKLVPPLYVPSVLSLSFFGGLWGIPCYFIAKYSSNQALRYWTVLIVFGAIFPTTVAMLVVFPLKGITVTSQYVVGGLVLNGLWGLGVALIFRVLKTFPRMK